ncbi:MAG: 1-deoxy-D-xylulose-5-phosphate synthase N-terminal domain-containing protein [Vicinamibacterales bacterium]|nr:1-deoxy-D-xylulose-5-phosphate synthase N-terminal domain-containing protein [Vicinamibacterales bacterium]
MLWLSTWMIHHANHVRPNRDGLKVGGHQASCASMVTLMTALFFDVLRPIDRVAVKPHGSPVFHAIQYLLGRQSRDQLERFRAFGGAQSYPSRTKDEDDVDISTGSVGMGVAMTSFAALAQEFLRKRGLVTADTPPGRMVAVAGDAEFDEGNVFEALLESWKHHVTNVWWVIDYNRQSLDAIVADRFFNRLDTVFQTMEWRVVTLKYGKRLDAAFAQRGGDALRAWIDDCPNSEYSALAYQGGAAWRTRLERDLGDTSGICELLDEHDDRALHRLMTNLAGHDVEAVREAFHAAADDETPACFIAYTIKGHGLPFEGHKDNHSGLTTPAQIAALRAEMGIAEGDEWEPLAGLDVPEQELRAFLDTVPFSQPARRSHAAPRVPVPATLTVPPGDRLSTQAGFGRVLADIARRHPDLADRIVTTSPDVTVSTNLGGWVNRRGVFSQSRQVDVFHEDRPLSAQDWSMGPDGQHLELGIAENNLFVLLAALGLTAPLFGARLLPVGTLYDPFISRGLDALNYACYQDARFILVATPSGVSLAPEGGAHQSVLTPLIGLGQPGLTAFEPAYVDELAEILRWSFEHIQADDGGAVYLRLSTRPLTQPQRELTADARCDIVDGGYWLVPPASGAELAIVASGAVVSEAHEAHRHIVEDIPGAGLLVVTSAGRLQQDWMHGSKTGDVEQTHVRELLRPLAPTAGLVTVLDGHPATLSWIGAVGPHRVLPLGVTRFGQSGDVQDLYRAYELDADAIVTAAARLCLERG